MTSFAALPLTNGETPPVTKTFSPAVIDNGIAMFEERSGGYPIGFPMLSLSLKRPPRGSEGKYRTVVKISLPVLEVTSPSTATGIQPAPTRAYESSATVEFVCAQRSSIPNRKDLLALMISALQNPSVIGMVVDLESVY